MENWNQLVPETTLTVIINIHNVPPIAVIQRIFPTFFFKVPSTTSHLPPAHHSHPPSHIHCFIPGSNSPFPQIFSTTVC